MKRPIPLSDSRRTGVWAAEVQPPGEGTGPSVSPRPVRIPAHSGAGSCTDPIAYVTYSDSGTGTTGASCLRAGFAAAPRGKRCDASAHQRPHCRSLTQVQPIAIDGLQLHSRPLVIEHHRLGRGAESDRRPHPRGVAPLISHDQPHRYQDQQRPRPGRQRRQVGSRREPQVGAGAPSQDRQQHREAVVPFDESDRAVPTASPPTTRTMTGAPLARGPREPPV